MLRLSINDAVEIFKILEKDQYSCLWRLIDDFEVNGHKVSIKDSTLWSTVVIDNALVCIKSNQIITDLDGITYNSGIDYAIAKLRK